MTTTGGKRNEWSGSGNRRRFGHDAFGAYRQHPGEFIRHPLGGAHHLGGRRDFRQGRGRLRAHVRAGLPAERRALRALWPHPGLSPESAAHAAGLQGHLHDRLGQGAAHLGAPVAHPHPGQVVLLRRAGRDALRAGGVKM